LPIAGFKNCPFSKKTMLWSFLPKFGVVMSILPFLAKLFFKPKS
jgi:hypothetical protein